MMHNINNLPKWAQRKIIELENRVNELELTLPWHEPGMAWCTLFHPGLKTKDIERKPTKLFVCSENGTLHIATIGKDDFVFIGRGKKQ